jgi:SAM-dependent methyltransferase
MPAIEAKEITHYEDRHWWHTGRRRIVADVLEQLEIPSGSRLLDAGCGAGGTLSVLSRYGEVSGLDMSPELVALARRRGYEDIHQGVVEKLPWADETFTAATLLDVLEHTADDRVTLEELRRVTRPGGHLLVTVPAHQMLWSSHDVINDHYRRYSRRTLRAAAIGAGWSIERMTPFNSLLLPPAAAVRLTQKLRRETVEEHTPDATLGPPWLYPVLELPLRAEASWLRRNRNLPVGLSLLAVLRR